MIQYKCFIIILTFSFFTTCKQDNNKMNSKKENKSVVLKTDSRNNKNLIFNDLDSLTIVTNSFTEKKIDSISSYKKEFKAIYYYCGKGSVNMKLFNFLKYKNTKDYNSLKSITTAHNVLINQDTLYISGRKGIECYKEKDSVNIKSTIYQINYQNNHINLIIIDEINKIVRK